MTAVSPQLMQRIRQDVQSMHAYAIQDSVGMVKLDAMENPYSLPHAPRRRPSSTCSACGRLRHHAG